MCILFFKKCQTIFQRSCTVLNSSWSFFKRWGNVKSLGFFRGTTSHQEGEGSGGQSRVQRKQMKMEQGKETLLPLEGVSQLPEEEGVSEVRCRWLYGFVGWNLMVFLPLD